MKNTKLTILLAILLFIISSCAQLKTRDQVKKQVKSSGDKVFASGEDDAGNESLPGSAGTPMDEHPAEGEVDEGEAAAQPATLPKISIIISAGGAKSIAGLGVIKAFRKAKIPIHSVSGVEFGSFVAALYAKSNSVNDAEWQLSKVKDVDLSKPLSNKELYKLIDTVWNSETIETFSTPFSCTSTNMIRKKTYVLAKGAARQVLSFCMPYPPLFEPIDQSYAAPKAIPQLIKYQLRQKSDIIVYVNVLNERDNDYVKPADSVLNLLWIENMFYSELDNVIQLNVPSRNYELRQLSAYRELINLGEMSAQSTIEKLQKNFGF